ncbi:hypothetical protein PLUA15_190131 [Pseudomonas lundensis]|uniref:Uncharacterized protein n=1 Tax=Pseudomonas lundensis TaxID=86185 RepID=A0AAX2H5H2_9PSED|nr:hypothetical protein PLUA15_190131 [Pseudomonas lundensis]
MYCKGILEYKKLYSKAVLSNIFVEFLFLEYKKLYSKVCFIFSY